MRGHFIRLELEDRVGKFLVRQAAKTAVPRQLAQGGADIAANDFVPFEGVHESRL
jgi:hypothetical protein